MLFGLIALLLSPTLDDGRARLDEGDLRGAMIRAEQAVRADPSDAQARLLLAEALLRLGDEARAEKMAAAAVKGGAGDPARLVRAESLIALGQIEQATRVASSAEPSPQRAAVLALAAAEEALSSGEPEAALRALPSAMAAPGFERRAELLAARAQYARGDLVRAEALVSRIVASDDDSFPALLLRARIALRAGDPASAGQLARAMLARDPGNVSATVVAVEAALRRGERDEARRLLSGLSAAGDDPRTDYLRALILMDEGRAEEVAEAVRPIEGWLTGAEGGAVLLARLQRKSGRLVEAETVLRDRLRTAPGDAAAAALLADILISNGKPERADEVLETARRINSAAAPLRARAAERLIAAGRSDDAMALLAGGSGAEGQLLGALSGGDGDTQTSPLVEAYAALRRGDAEAAMTAAEAAVADRRSAVALNLLAGGQTLSGDKAAARSTLSAAIDADPDFIAAIANLARLDDADGALLRALEAARAAGADSAEVLMQLSAERFVAGRDSAARDAAIAAAQAGGPEARLFAARISLLIGEDPSGDLSALIADQPENPAVVLPAAALLAASGGDAAASGALARLAERTGEPGHWLAAFEAATAAGDTELALASAKAARRATPTQHASARAYIAALASAEGLGAALAQAGSTEPLQPVHAAAIAEAAAGQRDAARQRLLASVGDLDRDALLYLASLSSGTSGARAASDALARYADRHPGDVPALVALGGALLDQGRSAAAERRWQQALRAAPNDPVVLNNLAGLRAATDPAGAERMAAAAYAAAPENPAIAETYADRLLSSGDREAAAKVLRRARLAAPGDPALAGRIAAISRR